MPESRVRKNRSWPKPASAAAGAKPSRNRRSERKRAPSHEFTDASRGERLQRVMADAGVGSRRHCEQLIESGAVRVNGHLVQSMPAWVDPAKDHITVNGKRIKTQEPHLYLMLFKPRGVVSTNSDPEGRTRAIDLVKHSSRARLYPVGRLDMESSGLLLLTNDGELANRLTHPRHEVPKMYEIVVAGAFDDDDVKRLEREIFAGDRRRVTVERKPDVKAQPRLTLLKRERDRTRMLIELGEGRSRQIRSTMADLGYKIRKLRRVQLGPLKLRGLQPGQWRELTRDELHALKRAAGIDEKQTRAASRRYADRSP